MTGFGKAFVENESKKYIVEVKSLNSKSFDLRMHLPSVFKEKEMMLRKLVAQSLHRGKVDFNLNIEDYTGQVSSHIDEVTFKKYHTILSNLGKELNEESDYFSLALNMPNVLKNSQEELGKDEWETVLKVTEEACKELNTFRETEGKRLASDLIAHVNNISKLQNEIKKYDKERIDSVRERIQSSLDLLNIKEMDNDRFEQEMIFYAEKFDINEEMVRLQSHCTYFHETIDKDNVQGKKLGFITQEMGREINTIGSKANHSDIQKIVVKMKDELGKIKEQNLNIL